MNPNLTKSIALLSVMAMIVVSMTAVMSFSDDVNAEDQQYDVDLGKKYSMTVQLIFDGKDAESILYDFGDGTPTSTEWNPIHTYASEGVYYITQTVYNSYQGGSQSTAVYKIEIMGYPEIHFETNGGSDVAAIQQTAYNVVASQPEDPVRDGYNFTGWYTDADCTQPYNWADGVKTDLTLYAGWESNGETPTPGGDEPTEPEEPEDEGFQIELWMIILIVVIIVVIIAVWYYRR